MPTPKFVNPSWRAIRILLTLALFFFLAAVPGFVMISTKGIQPSDNLTSAQMAFEVIAFTGGALATGMLLSALLTIPTARASDRVFANFLSGQPLAHWTYPEREWLAFVESQKREMRKGGLLLVCFFTGAFVFVGAIAAWSSGPSWHERLLIFSIATGSGLLISLMILAGGRIYAARRTKRLLQSPQTFIAKNGLYCGGDFNFWGSALRSLQIVRLQGTNPMTIEIVIGLSKTAGKVAAAADVISTITLHPTTTSNYKQRYVIPVPQGAEDQAKSVVTALGG